MLQVNDRCWCLDGRWVSAGWLCIRVSKSMAADWLGTKFGVIMPVFFCRCWASSAWYSGLSESCKNLQVTETSLRSCGEVSDAVFGVKTFTIVILGIAVCNINPPAICTNLLPEDTRWHSAGRLKTNILSTTEKVKRRGLRIPAESLKLISAGRD